MTKTRIRSAEPSRIARSSESSTPICSRENSSVAGRSRRVRQIERLELGGRGEGEEGGGEDAVRGEAEGARPGKEPENRGPLTEEIKEKLRVLKEMREEGLITEEEYQKKKTEVLEAI